LEEEEEKKEQLSAEKKRGGDKRIRKRRHDLDGGDKDICTQTTMKNADNTTSNEHHKQCKTTSNKHQRRKVHTMAAKDGSRSPCIKAVTAPIDRPHNAIRETRPDARRYSITAFKSSFS
jgi:hypothetical protein